MEITDPLSLEQLCRFLGLVHDMGKLTAAFQYQTGQCHRRHDGMRPENLKQPKFYLLEGDAPWDEGSEQVYGKWQKTGLPKGYGPDGHGGRVKETVSPQTANGTSRTIQSFGCTRYAQAKTARR